MLCKFLLQSIESATGIHASPPSLSPPSHQPERPVLYSCCPLAVCLTHGTVYVSVRRSQFLPPCLFPSVSTSLISTSSPLFHEKWYWWAYSLRVLMMNSLLWTSVILIIKWDRTTKLAVVEKGLERCSGGNEKCLACSSGSGLYNFPCCYCGKSLFSIKYVT